MGKTTTFYNGDPAEVKFFTPKETKEKYVKRRDEARKNPAPFALVQHPEVYDK